MSEIRDTEHITYFDRTALPGGQLSVAQFIVTNLKTLGDGREMVYRGVLQLWTMDGRLVLEFDPFDGKEGVPGR
jgi:hypothetical protein